MTSEEYYHKFMDGKTEQEIEGNKGRDGTLDKLFIEMTKELATLCRSKGRPLSQFLDAVDLINEKWNQVRKMDCEKEGKERMAENGFRRLTVITFAKTMEK